MTIQILIACSGIGFSFAPGQVVENVSAELGHDLVKHNIAEWVTDPIETATVPEPEPTQTATDAQTDPVETAIPLEIVQTAAIPASTRPKGKTTTR